MELAHLIIEAVTPLSVIALCVYLFLARRRQPAPTTVKAPEAPANAVQHDTGVIQVVTYPALEPHSWVSVASVAHQHALDTPGLAVRKSFDHPVDPGRQ